MSKETVALTPLNPKLKEFQDDLRAKFAVENKTASKNQIVFVGSSLMEIFPIDKMQEDLHLDKHIYNRGIRATTTADLLEHLDSVVLDLTPSKIFINIGSNDIGFKVPEEVMLDNYDKILSQFEEKLPDCQVYAMAYYPVNTVDDFSATDPDQRASNRGNHESHESKEQTDKEHQTLFEHRSNDLNAAVSEKVAKVAEKHGFHFINVNAGLTDENGNLRKELTFDGAHMLPAGYAIVLENMKPYLKD